MRPKIQLRYSWMYNRLFNPNFKKDNLAQLKNKCKGFEKIYAKNINKILEIIENNFFLWKEEYIPVFIIDSGSVFYDPITIRYDRNPKIMLIRLFHELIHLNIKNKKFKNEYYMHKWMDERMMPLLDKIPTNLADEVHVLNRMTHKWKEKYKP